MKILKFIKNIVFRLIQKVGILSRSSLKFDENIEVIDARDERYSFDVMYKNSNTIIKITNDGKKCFFKECRPILNKSDFLKLLNDDYMFFSKKSLIPKIKNKKRFFSMGSLSDKYSSISKFFITKKYELLGLENPTNKDEERIFIDYAKFVWSEVYNYKLNASFKRRKYETFNAARSLSFFSIAKLFNLSYLVPNTRLCKIVGFGNYDRIGVLMDDAKGTDLSEITPIDRKNKVDPLLQKEFLNLNILDAICFEKDHRPDNYNVIFNKNGDAESICVFDNDSPMSFFLSNKISFETYEGCSPLVKGKWFYRPFIDSTVYKRINNINKQEIVEALAPYLHHAQIDAFISRFTSLKKAINKSIESGKCKLIEKEWNSKTMETELSGAYGLSYLGLYVSGWVNPNNNLANE